MQRNKTVLITGSSRGIGRAAALAFAADGYNVILNCVKNKTEMEKTAEEIRRMGGKVSGFCCDVSDCKAVEEMFDKINKSFGGVEVLVNNAGVSFYGLFQDMTEEERRKVIGINLMGVFNVTGCVLPYMISNKKGAIINISSIWGNVGGSCEAVYSASKGGVNAFTRALGKELGPCGIRVNAVSCGCINTDMNNNLSPEEKAALAGEIPLMRFGEAGEIAKLVLFLASEAASYINGQIITADGGFL
ncbi:MAG: 3-oxoacyl-ACP reductase FabG [Clostridiales bacterium]|nr:3-oxoacyl-ACP reductase FabG [Clostridiales bacterium]